MISLANYTINCPGDSSTPLYSEPFFIGDCDNFSIAFKGKETTELDLYWQVSFSESRARDDEDKWYDGMQLDIGQNFISKNWLISDFNKNTYTCLKYATYVRVKIIRKSGNDNSNVLYIRHFKKIL